MGKEKLARLLWDSPSYVTGEELFDHICGTREISGIDRRKLIARMLVSIRWYDLVDIFGLERMVSFLDDETIALIWREDLRSELHHVRNILSRVLRPAV